MGNPSPPAIVWFRRDLRLTDHTALLAATTGGSPVLPTYVLSDWQGEHAWTGNKRQAFLSGCLASLDANLRSRGSYLVVRRGDPCEEILALAAETGATSIHCARDPDPHGQRTEKRLARAAEEAGLTLHIHKDHALHEQDEVLTGGGTPYRVFTPYFRNWVGLPKAAPQGGPRSLKTPSGIASLELPTVASWGLTEPSGNFLDAGERAARKRLKDALKPGGTSARYLRDRDTPAGHTTSRLSQDLRFGILSVREVVASVQKAVKEAGSAADRAGHETLLKELAWREFYMGILHHFPEVLRHEFNPDWRGLPWDREEGGDNFQRWCSGQTGFPIVDAGMRQLAATGFMHNRVRMIVSMFLTKDLHIDWRLGERFFMQHLLDGEIASNNGGWQWSAGTGADAAPYFRIQNPWTQSKRFDPDGAYIREWIPELLEVPAKRLQSPPQPLDPLAPGYPAPIVDHAAERLATLEIFKAHRASSGP